MKKCSWSCCREAWVTSRGWPGAFDPSAQQLCRQPGQCACSPHGCSPSLCPALLSSDGTPWSYSAVGRAPSPLILSYLCPVTLAITFLWLFHFSGMAQRDKWRNRNLMYCPQPLAQCTQTSAKIFSFRFSLPFTQTFSNTFCLQINWQTLHVFSPARAVRGGSPPPHKAKGVDTM